MSESTRAATLAIGTEITDGDVVDQNSAWLSVRLVDMGFAVSEHRSVPDSRAAILAAVRELAKSNQLLFVTGGLGPTSDDFTREIIAEAAGLPLELSEDSWSRIQLLLESRGVEATESQKRQCYFPRGWTRFLNSMGTADGFSGRIGACEAYVLPGPPAEVAELWQTGVAWAVREAWPQARQFQLKIWRLMGRGESYFADLTERVLHGSGLRLGYRAHPPYVEVKVWLPVGPSPEVLSKIDDLERELVPWLVNRDHEDLMHDLVERLSGEELRLTVYDSATLGLFSERVSHYLRLKNRAELSLRVIGTFAVNQDSARSSARFSTSDMEMGLELRAEVKFNRWNVVIHRRGVAESREISPQFNYQIQSERARQFLVERALQFVLEHFDRTRLA